MQNKVLAVLLSVWYVFLYYILRPLDCVAAIVLKGFPYKYWPHLGELFKYRWSELGHYEGEMLEVIKNLWDGYYE